MRNEDSFTSKQTNEYIADLLLKNQQPMPAQDRRLYESPKIDTSPSVKSCDKRTSSNDTARLSFSKDQGLEDSFDRNKRFIE